MIYGEAIIKWYSSHFQDPLALNYFNLYLYGGFFEVIAQLATRIFPFGLFETRHLINAAFGLLAIAYAYKCGTQLSSPLGGFLSALFLALTPVFYGHFFNNPKDLPFASLFLVSLHYLFRVYNALPRFPKKLIVKLGLSIGLTMGIRVGGIVLLGYLLVFCLAWLVSRYALKLLPLEALLREGKSIGMAVLYTLVVTWAVMLVWWPWALLSPIDNPVRALQETAKFQFNVSSFFNGHTYPASQLPWTYVPVWLAVSLPEFYFVSLLVGLAFTTIWLSRFQKTPAYLDRAIKLSLLVFAFCFPIVSSIILRSTNYDGLRHFLFVIPPLALLAGVSLEHLFRTAVSARLKTAISVVVAVSLMATIVDMVQLHPYQSIYFNRIIAGGVKGGAARFETDYGGSSYKEGAEWVIQNYHQNSPGRTLIANCAVPFLTSYYFNNSEVKDRFITVFQNQNPQIFLANTRFDCQNTVKGKVLHVVERKGVPLLYVIQVEE